MESNDEFCDPFSYSRAPTIGEKLGCSPKNLPLLTLTLVFIASNLLLPRLFADAHRSDMAIGLAFAAAGALCAQLAALATWLGLGAGSLILRLAYTVPLVFVVAISCIIGLQFLDGRLPLTLCLFILGIAVGGFLFLSLPLLILRRVGKLVIARARYSSVDDDTTFSIGFLLALTGIVAAMIALLKFILADGDSTNGPQPNDIWILAWLCVHQTVSATFIFLPCFWLGMARRQRSVAFFFATIALACVPAINFLVLQLYGNGFRDSDILVNTYAFSIGLGLNSIAIFWIVALVGFKMQRVTRV